MSETLPIISERVDDIPLLLAQLARMGLQARLDADFATHGNWVGLSLGWVSVLWLTHILSEADHRLNHVKPWVEHRLHTLREGTGQLVHPLDVSDDRLATVLEALSDDTGWSAFERALNQYVRRVYDLQPACVRLDSPTASGHWRVTEDGLFQFGHSQDHRPDRPQVKVMIAALDPLGMPVATDVVLGQRADDPLYLPAITRVREGLGRGGVLDGGDGKMGALEPRAFLHAGGDDYLGPLSKVQLPPAVLAAYLAPVWMGQQALTMIHRLPQAGTPELIAEGFERWEPVTAEVAGTPPRWLERRLVIRAFQRAQAGERGLRARLANAQEAITALNKRGRGRDGAPIRAPCGKRWTPSWRAIGCKACCTSGLRNNGGSARCGAMAAGRPPCGWSGTCRWRSASPRRQWPRQCANWAGGSMSPPSRRTSCPCRRRSWRTAASIWSSGRWAA
jgi:hypothetical protein